MKNPLLWEVIKDEQRQRWYLLLSKKELRTIRAKYWKKKEPKKDIRDGKPDSQISKDICSDDCKSSSESLQGLDDQYLLFFGDQRFYNALIEKENDIFNKDNIVPVSNHGALFTNIVHKLKQSPNYDEIKKVFIQCSFDNRSAETMTLRNATFEIIKDFHSMLNSWWDLPKIWNHHIRGFTWQRQWIQKDKSNSQQDSQKWVL